MNGGQIVFDTAQRRVGRVMDKVGTYIQLRPLGGGREWDADPERLRPPTPRELLSARLAAANRDSESGPIR
ncbi:hypothetical protein ACH4FX_12630 [Streptomyces sp. NPDC018019]|uniref:hypothetical protein n=1 Tax=Streptomyces sp. NPDC018019 TaxID=3365030 RepID=UPI00378F8759